MARNKTLRTREAGALVEQCCYTRAERGDSERVRGAKRKKTNEAMSQYNDKSSRKKLELMLAANFALGDLVVAMTFDDQHIPDNRKSVARCFRYFRQKIEKHYRSAGSELRAIWSIEHKHGDGRWHVHMIINAVGNDYDAIRAAWIYGSDIDITELRVDSDENYATLAEYYSKEGREKIGLRVWSYTRSCVKPTEDVERVESSYRLQAPEGVIVLENNPVETPFGEYEYLKYIVPWALERGVKARRRRAKR